MHLEAVMFHILFNKIIVTPLILTLLIFSQIAGASSIKQIDINDLLLQSELVFQGKVLSKSEGWNASKTDIFTEIVFQVDDVVVGSYNESTLSLSFVGGTVDGMTVEIQGSELPKMNERGVYFVESLTQSMVNPLVGWAQGHFLLQEDDNGEPRIMTQSRQAVMSMKAAQVKSGLLSSGVATGLRTEKMTSSIVSKAMSATQFKMQLKEQFQSLVQAGTVSR